MTNNTYAVSFLLERIEVEPNKGKTVVSMTLHAIDASSEDEAKDLCLAKMMEMKPDFSVKAVLCLPVTKEPANV